MTCDRSPGLGGVLAGPIVSWGVDVCDTLLVSQEQENADGVKVEEPVLANARRTQADFVGWTEFLWAECFLKILSKNACDLNISLPKGDEEWNGLQCWKKNKMFFSSGSWSLLS